MVSRHEFLAELHALLKPKTYLEIGVQHGWSLDLAHAAEVAIGIDPMPLVEAKGNQIIYQMTSDEAFKGEGAPVTIEIPLAAVTECRFPQSLPESRQSRSAAGVPESHTISPIDFAFIDGMHLFEYVLRDFMNVVKYTHENSVIVFDDVLPRNQEEANRVQCPGDWTGDVWKIYNILGVYRPDYKLRLVDTQPTGVLVAVKRKGWRGLNRAMLERNYDSLVKLYSRDMPVPDDVLSREYAWQPEDALEEIRRRMEPEL